jgi:hypothetical protein
MPDDVATERRRAMGDSIVTRTLFKTACLICCLPLLTAADIYRWVDADGVVNYTQQKPRGIDAELVSGPANPRADVTRAPQAERPTVLSGSAAQPALNEDQQGMLRDLQAAEEARQQEVARVREDNCTRARSVLTRLTAKGRIRVRGEDGEYQIMNEEERQSRISEAQEGIALNCHSADA